MEHRYTINGPEPILVVRRQENHQAPMRRSPAGKRAVQKGRPMPKVFVSTVINAPIERVWRVVGDFNGLPAWMPGMTDSVIEDGKGANDVGAVRRLSMAEPRTSCASDSRSCRRTST